MVLLANVEAFVQPEGGSMIGISCNQYLGTIHPEGYQYIESFKVSDHVAEWCYDVSGTKIIKKIAVHYGRNTTTISYANAWDRPFLLFLRPLVAHRYYHHTFHSQGEYPHFLDFVKDRTILEHHKIPLILEHEGAKCVPSAGWYYRFEYVRDMERGLEAYEDLFNPCELQYELQPNESISLVASTVKNVRPYVSRTSNQKGRGLVGACKSAASKFLVKTEARTSILAGYPWFGDWGRDTMISIPGICLCTGRIEEAKQIILDYTSHMKQGLIPNRFVERSSDAEYASVDSTLWLANAMYKTLLEDWDTRFAQRCSEVLEEVFEWHQKGTLYGIHVDPKDGLLTQGEQGVQLTWMDAKVGDWVVTPRYGKPVEVNGLWINALRIMEWLAEKLGKPASTYKEAALLVENHFHKKFWRDTLGYYLDTAEPDDASLRPNQVIAMGLPFSPLDPVCARKALKRVTAELLTPMGLRTLSPSDANYRGHYRGSLPELDAAYHQGTVWPWLLGSYVSALVKLTGDRMKAKQILEPFSERFTEYGLGGIAEVYDGDEPHSPGGCPWQAWSVAEILRAWTEDASEEPS
jgi:predicted glycogen debranching enzyme